MKKRTTGFVAILWGIGALAIVVAIVLVRFRFDQIAEFTI